MNGCLPLSPRKKQPPDSSERANEVARVERAYGKARALGTSRGNVHVIRCRDLEKLRHDEEFITAANDPNCAE